MRWAAIRTALASSVLALGIGWGAGLAPGALGQEQITIGALLFQGDTFFQNVQAGMEAAAAENDVRLIVNNTNNDPAQEATFVETYTSSGVDAIVISALSPDGSVASVRNAADAGIHVICYNSCINDEAATEYVEAFIQTDQMALGSQTGAYAETFIAEQLGGTARIGILNCDKFEACQQRKTGFLDALDGLEVEVVADQEGFLADTATDVAENILTAHPDIDLLWAANEGGTIGAMTAVKNRGGEAVPVFGTDMSEPLAQGLLDPNNILQAVTGQAPVEMGRQAIMDAIAAVNGESIEPFQQVTPNVFFSRADPAAVEAYLNPAPATPVGS